MKTDCKIAIYLFLKAVFIVLYLLYIGILTPIIENQALSIIVIITGAIITLFLLGLLSKKIDKTLKENEEND